MGAAGWEVGQARSRASGTREQVVKQPYTGQAVLGSRGAGDKKVPGTTPHTTGAQGVDAAAAAAGPRCGPIYPTASKDLPQPITRHAASPLLPPAVIASGSGSI